MRINCEVQVNNRKLPSLNISNKRGGTRSSLGIGRHPGSKADVSSLFIHLCTAQHKLGTKYKVGGNIEAVFTKFVAEGKFTIRFKEPSHDLCVKADPVLAKTFLQTLKQGIQNKDIEKLRLSNLNPVKQSQVEKPMTKLIIRSKQEYPITTAFPYSLEILKMEYLPHTLGRLCNLVSLKIDGNKLRKLPASLGKLTRMKYLTASNNNLVELPGSLMHLRMDTVDVFGNPLSSPLGLVTNNITGVPRLKEITSAYCVQRGLRPTAADIPATLVDYLQAWCKCGCGRICYETHILACISLNLKLVASALAIDTAFQTSAPALAVLCSQKCFDKCFKR
ncbi:leucine-rich repeat protein 1-like isoform X2 [Homarus americanus]|uniref:leucine-rich repeat protein 1-like isoform X2 n=1 Tax=Homarus americanus TaxID=6706 RepID=UPI001C48A76E|nr:leucine-rich repeat protein 1-like isoform X2 [Homarus americanus]